MRRFCARCLEFHAANRVLRSQDPQLADRSLQKWHEDLLIPQLAAIIEGTEKHTRCQWCYEACLFKITDDHQLFRTLLAAAQFAFPEPVPVAVAPRATLKIMNPEDEAAQNPPKTE